MTDDERARIVQRFGEASCVWDEAEQEHRTAIADGQCFFLRDNACVLHDADFYPRMCRHFPERNLAGDGPYEHDVSICPELIPLVHEGRLRRP